MSETTVGTMGHAPVHEGGLTSAVTSSPRRICLAGLGAVALASEEGERLFRLLEQKGEELAPRVTADAGKAARTFVERAAAAARSVETAAANAAARLAA